MPVANVSWPEIAVGRDDPARPDLLNSPGRLSRCHPSSVVLHGLSTALHLREEGVDVAIVESHGAGLGASGRNNGQVIPTLSRPDPDDIIARHGATGETVRRAVARQCLCLVRRRAALSNSG